MRIVGSHVGLVNNRGVVAVAREDKEITNMISKGLYRRPGYCSSARQEIIDVTPREFIVDGYDGTGSVGMLGYVGAGSMIITGL